MHLEKYGNLLVFSLLIILVLIFFFEVIFFNKTFAFRDMARSYYPYKYFIAETIKNGDLPLWNQYIACGFPFFASINSGVFYPPVILCCILPFQIGFNIFYIFHYILALIFMYLLAKDFKFSSFSSLFTAICFVFGGYFVSILDTPSFTSVVWFPLTLLLFRRSLLTESKIYTVFAGFSMSMQILNGDPLILYATFIILLIYLIVYKERITSYFRLFLIFFIGIGVSAIQLVPAFELFKISDRLDFKYEDSTYWSLPPWHLINLIIPFSFGDFTKTYTDWDTIDSQGLLKSLYLGVVPLIFSFLAIVNLVKVKTKENIFFCLILCISLFLVFGKYTPVYKFFYNFVPGLSNMRFPVKFFFITAFSIALLSGRGIDYVISTKSKKQVYIKILIFIEIFIIILSLIASLGKEQIFSFLKIHFYKDLDFYNTYLMVVRADEIISRILQMCIIFSLTVCLISLLRLNKISNLFFLSLVIIILIIDIFPVGMKLNTVVDSDLYHKEEKNITFLKRNLYDQRIFLLPDEETNKVVFGRDKIEAFRNAKKSLYPSLGIIYSISNIRDYEAVAIKRYNNLGYGILKKGKKRNSPLLDLLGVKYLLTFWELPEKFKFVREDYVKIYENPTYLPRAFVINNAKFVRDEYFAFKEIISPDFDPTAYAIIEDERIQGQRIESVNTITPAEVKYLNPNTVSVEVDAPSRGYLVLTDTYYPGWKAYIDGKESKIYIAYYTFRAVEINKGKHSITFFYRPVSLKIGLIITLVFLFILSLFLLKKYNKK